MGKRIVLFLLVNVLVIITISLLLGIVGRELPDHCLPSSSAE